MITHNQRNAGYLINISVGLLSIEMAQPVISGALRNLTGF